MRSPGAASPVECGHQAYWGASDATGCYQPVKAGEQCPFEIFLKTLIKNFKQPIFVLFFLR
jgi:hypothetical protein